MDIIKLSPQLAFSDQPSVRALHSLNKFGFRTLVNVRLATEQPTLEESAARRAGLRYVHLPIAQPEWSVHHFQLLDAALRRRHALPALVHSGEGARAGVLALTWHAMKSGWSVEELMSTGGQLGLSIPAAAKEWLYRGDGASYPEATRRFLSSRRALAR
jgi:uncharacterized protein (TIGR01244 family)